MDWKTLKNKIENQGMQETDFVLGIDLGSATSTLAFFDANRSAPEVIDLSGGYGKQSIPTVVQYIPDTKEWVFGEYAVLNRGFGNEVTIMSMIDRLGTRDYVDIEKKPMSYTNILTYFVKELVNSCFAINPKATIGGIVLAIPEYLSEEAKEELSLVFNTSGYGKAVIGFASDKECIFHHYYYNKEVKDENVLLLDFGNREIRGGIYAVTANGGEVHSKSLSYLFNKDLSTGVLDRSVEKLFMKHYLEEHQTITPQTEDLISAFSYQHKDLLFQKNIDKKPLKLYFNFAYPPFQKTITKDFIDEMLEPHRNALRRFIDGLFAKAPEHVTKDNINTVICTGGGFEMLWVREEIKNIFSKSDISINKYAKGAIAEGACLIAAGKVSAIESKRVVIEDNNKINVDIGVQVKSGNVKKFIPVIERNSFWWQEHEDKVLIINEDTSKPLFLEIFKRDRNGDQFLLDTIEIEGLPKRPKGATRIGFNLAFHEYNRCTATVKDFGFGDLFAPSDYEKKFEVNTFELGRL